MEQTSSEITATYKTSIISGENIIDITGGFGVDCSFFTSKFKNVTHCELNSQLSEIAKHNFNQLKINNIRAINDDGIKVVENSFFDVIYADPSRRHDTKGKVFFLNDCKPNIPKHLSALFKRAPTLLIKTSPMLDISVGMKELNNVAEIHIVAINNEVKELLWILKRDFVNTPTIKTINIKKGEDELFSFMLNSDEPPNYENPMQYLYEPNVAIMKSGAFDLLCSAFKVAKLSKHSHLYTSKTLLDFPGRRFIISEIVPYSKKQLRQTLGKIKKANVTTRNFKESVSELRKKWKISEGGEIYLFFTTLHNGDKVMLCCKKIKNPQ